MSNPGGTYTAFTFVHYTLRPLFMFSTVITDPRGMAFDVQAFPPATRNCLKLAVPRIILPLLFAG